MVRHAVRFPNQLRLRLRLRLLTPTGALSMPFNWNVGCAFGFMASHQWKAARTKALCSSISLPFSFEVPRSCCEHGAVQNRKTTLSFCSGGGVDYNSRVRLDIHAVHCASRSVLLSVRRIIPSGIIRHIAARAPATSVCLKG